jgi:hypothetical protein
MDSIQNNRECFYGNFGSIRRDDKYLLFFDGTIYFRHYYKTRENGPDSIGAEGSRTWPENGISRSLVVRPDRSLP